MSTPLRILLVNNSRDEREMYAECLRQEGFCTLQANSATEAYRLAAEMAPGVVVTALELSGQADGLALARQLKAQEPTRGVPVVVLSGYDSPRYREAASSAGCDVFLVKPCLPAEFVDVVARLAARQLQPQGS